MINSSLSILQVLAKCPATEVAAKPPSAEASACADVSKLDFRVGKGRRLFAQQSRAATSVAGYIRARFIFCQIALQVLALSFLTSAHAIETDAAVRDPSTIVKRGDTYWVYSTGRGIPQWSSTDLQHWTRQDSVFRELPAWVKTAVPAINSNIVWAPDVHQVGTRYFLYYSVSTFGSNVSTIGLATNETLDPRGWTDGGMVVQSKRGERFNAIDPCVFDDEKGDLWLSFGSFFGGLQLVALDKTSGKIAPNSEITTIATRPDDKANSIEAPAIYFHDGYYYLWVNWDKCCADAGSSYNIRVGRARDVRGPYLDKDGKDLREGGGSIFLTSLYDDQSGRLIDDRVGPGHVGILKMGDDFRVSLHYEWSRVYGAADMLNVYRLAWDADGWPRALFDEAPQAIVSALPTHGLLTPQSAGQNDGAAMQTFYDKNLPVQRWNLQYQSGGFYAILNAADKRALSVIGDASQPGAKVDLLAFENQDNQLWDLRQNADGTYLVLPKSGAGKMALDVVNCQLQDGAALGQWTLNGLNCQNWSLRAH